MINKRFFKFLYLIIFVFPLYTNAGEIRLVPQPKELVDLNKQIELKKHVNVYISPQSGLSKSYVSAQLIQKGLSPNITKQQHTAHISFTIDAVGIKEKDSYRLKVNDSEGKFNIQVIANSKNGLLYGLATICQLLSNNGSQLYIPACTIYDYPTFPWRAFMLDEARHFQGKEMVRRLLDEMAALKMNIFHWHLVDDQGWRIEIKKYPLLAKVGSRSNFSLHHNKITPLDTGKLEKNAKWYYTQQEIREIIQYADERGITILPEIEVPGHASASLYAYPWLGASSKQRNQTIYGDLYDVTDSKVEQFIKDVLNEIIALFPGKTIHIGGDEANYSHWQNSPAINEFMKQNSIPTYMDLQIWSINRLSKHIASKGARMIGWNEITGENIRNEEHVQKSESEQLAPGTIVQFWDGDVSLVNKALEKGYDVVNSSRFFTYLDYDYETTSLEKVFSFNPVPDGVAIQNKHKVLGLGGQMWGEFTLTKERIYYQVFPRIAAIAECGWVEHAKKTSYANFKQRFTLLEARWKALGYIKDQAGKY